MTRVQKIKSYFRHNEIYLWKNFTINHKITFDQLTDDILLDLAQHLQNNLKSVNNVGNRRHRLVPNKATQHHSVDDILILLSEIITVDYVETVRESEAYNWNFRYYVDHHKNCENTLKICTALQNKENSHANCIYTLASIQKIGDIYYCWNHAAAD